MRGVLGVRYVRPAPTMYGVWFLEAQPRNVRGLHASMYLAGQQGCGGEGRRKGTVGDLAFGGKLIISITGATMPIKLLQLEYNLLATAETHFYN